MRFPIKILKKSTLLLLATSLVISSFVVYAAYVDRTVYTTEQLVIIPDKVTSDSWVGLNSVLVQDVSEYSLYQDFDENNSAYISELSVYSKQSTPETLKADGATEAQSASTTDEVAPEGGEAQPAVDAPTEAPAALNPEPAAPEESTESSSVPESAPQTLRLEQSDLVWGGFVPSRGAYPLAQGVVDEPTNEPASAPSASGDEAPVESVSGTGESSAEQPAADTPVESAQGGGSATEEDSASSTDDSATSSTEVSEGDTEPSGEVNAPKDAYALSVCNETNNCATHSMVFSGFTLPDFESGTVLDSAQLRLSLGAKTKSHDESVPQRYVVEYSYEAGTTTKNWVTASVIDIGDEISNSINGGYFLISLDTPDSAGKISNLQVRISYQGDVSKLDRAYVEGIWLEVQSGKFFESGDADPYSDALTNNRDLLQPTLNTLSNPDLDPTLGTLPSFTLSYDPQQNFFSRIFKRLFSENTFAVDQLSLTDSSGNKIAVPFEIIYHENNTWTVNLKKQPQSLKPGTYTITATMLENGEPRVDSFEFYWGLLAVNTKKSMYFPNEKVELNLAALTDDGTTICDADLHLKIIDPKNNFFEVPVEQSGSCGPNNVTDIPDYIAKFANTGEWGVYTIQLENRNTAGKVVHKVQDSFEVREYIPFDIERSAPTRIYPPSPYSVTLDITAYRDFTGDITERVPRGFVMNDIAGATISSLPEYSLITWHDMTMKEGDKLHLTYTFDAPDVSPYMYLLGPLDMDGFSELRQWQIASDALNNIGWFTGTRTVAGTNLNNGPSPLQWSTSTEDTYYFAHATSTDSNKVTLRQDGDYLVSVTLPMERTDANVSRTRGSIEVRVNGVTVPQGVGRSGIIMNTGAHSESSSHVSFLLTQVHANDYIEVFEENIDTVDVGDVLNVTAQAAMYLEYIRPTETVFAATTTRTTSSTNLNQVAAFPLEWTETRQDSGLVHSNTVNPQNIMISASGTYMVHINIPITGVGNTIQQNLIGKVLLNGVQVNGGLFQQGYLEASTTEGDGDASIHWSGIVVATTTNQVLTVTTQLEAGAGTTTVTPGFVGSIFVQKLPTSGVIALAGRDLVAGTNWNNAASTSVKYDTRLSYDNTAYTHSTSTNSHQIVVTASGDYLITVSDALTNSATTYTNSRITIQVSSSTYRGAQTKSNLIRFQNGHSDSSGSLVYLLEGLTAGQVVTVNTAAEATAGTVNDNADSLVLMWKKASLNFRAPSPSMFNTPFDNVRLASTTPYFDFMSNDPDGSSGIQYQFSISTSSSFIASTTRSSGVDAGFSNTASSTNVSPFVENNRVRYQLQAADALSDLTTYYWRVRAKDAAGSGEYGDWSTTQSLTINAADTVPNWFQTTDGQFTTNTLVGTVTNLGNNDAEVDSGVSSEILIGYGDSTSATPKYRLWNGTSWGIEQSAVAVAGTINWVRTAAGIKRDEYIMVTMDQANDSYAQVYNASSSSWGNRTTLSTSVSNITRRGIAVGYESVSGDAMAVSCDTTKNPVYRIWNGSTWSATSSITTSLTNVCNFIEIASDPASDEMIVLVRDSGAAVGNNYEALVWDGSSFVASRRFGSVVAGQELRSGMTVKYESSGDQAIIAVRNANANSFIYTTWTGSAFTTNATQPLQNDFDIASLNNDPNSDNMAVCLVNDSARVEALRWDGGVWSTYTDLTTLGNSAGGRPIDCEYETTAGRGGNLLATYSDTTNLRYQVYATSSWSGQQTVSGVGAGTGVFWVQTEQAGDGTIVAVTHDDAVVGDEIESTYWNGTAWSAKQSIVPNPSSIIGVPYETFEMAAKRYQYTQGTVTTAAISFSAVPNQTRWGDLTFSSTEPFGTDVTVRLKYTSTSTCDSYVPNGALAGNGVGFDAADLPLNLTALSTTTYSQLCLEATLTTFGSASAQLLDWSLAWTRKPKLAQSTFRWYGNGSYFTPTDPWPLGATDVNENNALSASEAINSSDVIRLRLSLQGLNVPLPTSTAAFKLQYASGLSCAAATGWADVGSTSSSTAVWRGYANSIVGSDWLSASWQRRIKVTVKNTMVSGSQADFPVYINLADLPAAFFSAVKSDGSDIRITKSDGLSEVPFELVSINTTTKVGEVHFKANITSTSSTDYFVYYANPSASAYAVSATYGARNVWTNSYAGVYHMLQDPTGSAPQILDSTANAKHASKTGTAGAGLVVDGQLGKALDFVGTAGDYTLDFPTYGFTGTASFTYSAWFKTGATTDGGGGDGNGTYMVDRVSPDNDLAGLKAISGSYGHQFRYSDGSGLGAVTGSAITPAAWQQVVWGRAYNSNRFIVVNGVTATTTDNTSALIPPQNRFGGHNGNTNYTGLVDEVRVSSIARSTSWNVTEYNNQSNPTGFYTLSSEEFIGDGRALTSTLLTGSDYAETYEEANPTNNNRFAIPVGDNAEWDFAIQNNGAPANTNYCFRMVYSDGSILNTYTTYPRLVTNAAPPAPTLSAPFDNRQLASTSPFFEFTTTDEAGDLVSYEIVVDNDYDFSSPAISKESNAQFSLFTNLSSPSERGAYSSGQVMRFVPNTALTNGVTYWWRVRAKDDFGSNTYGEWSEPKSFTVNTATVLTTWYQTTGEQFGTDSYIDTIASTSTNDVGIDVGLTNGTTTSTAVDYDSRELGNAWGQVSFTQNVTSGSVRHYVEYMVSANTYALVPDADLPGNSSGFTTSPISISSLDTTTYNVLRVMSVLTGSPTLPRLQDMTITWSQKIEAPTLLSLFDNAKSATTTPAFTFTTADPQSDDLQYEVQISSNAAFTSSSTYLSTVNPGFSNVASTSDTSPFNSGQTVQYKVQSALTNGLTYFWRARARDPGGSNSWSNYSAPYSFTIDTATTISVWYQTVGDQFATDDLVDIETPAGGAQISSIVNGVMAAYGEGTGQAPQYRLWNGSTWSGAASADSVGAQIGWTKLKAAPTRPEYALATLGTDLDINIQIYDSVAEAWGNMFKIYDNSLNATRRLFDIGYETNSGRLLAVACTGNNAVYSLWNGTSWSATSTITLAKGNSCEWVQMASDPTSNEIIAVFRHTNTGTPDYEALVWNGSSWGNSTRFGDVNTNTDEAMVVQYEESGNQAMVAFPNAATLNLLWKTWNGSTWSATGTVAMGARMTWGSLKRDVGSDNMALCYIDSDADIGVLNWDGSAWGTFNELTTVGNSAAGQPVDCEFQTTQGTDGDLVIPYSDTTAGRYKTYTTATGTYSGEFSLDVINNSWRFQTVRGGDGTVHVFAFDDGSTPDRYDTSRWDGSAWTVRENFSTNPSITVQPYDGSLTAAAQIYPNFTNGTIRSTAINFADGNSPRWERVRFTDTTPGASDIRYRVYYESSAGVYSLISDAALSGNSTGFTNSPIDISGLDRTVYAKLKLDADLICDSGNCPSVQDWSVEWSQGITVSGSALEYDQVTAVATGTIAVAVNGVLQVGKTANIAAGTTTQQMIYTTAGTSTFTVPTGVTNVTVKAWGAGGGSGAGGASDVGGAGGGAGFVQGNITVIPGENLSVFVGGGGTGGVTGIPAGAAGGGGYSGLMRTTTPLAIAGAGGGGGGATGGIRFVNAGTACATTAATCSPVIPTGTAVNDVYIAVLNSRTNTAHTCTTNCTGWTEFSTQAGSAGEGRLSVWYYRQTGAAPANPTFGGPATETYTGRIWAFRGVTNTGNPYDVLGTNTAIVTATTTFAGSNLTSTVPEAMTVFVGTSMDDNTWGPASGTCTVPNTINANFYAANTNGTDNSLFLCYKENPTSAPGQLGIPVNTQATLGADAGRYFTFALKPRSTTIVAAGNGGVGGGVVGGTGSTASSSVGGGAGSQSSGGSIGGGNATVGSAYAGGNGSTGIGGGAGGAGGVNGGGAGGTADFATLEAGGGGGGAGYYGGGGGDAAAGAYLSGAGGGGGSSYIMPTATATSTASGSSTAAGNAIDSDYSAGAGAGASAAATSTNGGSGNAGRVVVTWSTAASPGTWSIPNVSAFAGDVVTVFMTGATGSVETVGITKYDGAGDITGMQLSKRHLTIGSNDAPTITNADLALYTNALNEDVFYSVSGANLINLCAESTCADARLRILSGATYAPGANTTVVNFENYGTFAPATSTFRVSSEWRQMATFVPDQSTVIFTATSSTFTPVTATSTFAFYNLTFGESSSTAVWTMTKPLVLTGSLAVDRGTLARGTSTISVERNMQVSAGGAMTGLATTSFVGAGSFLWTDTTASSTNIGYAVIDGAAKTVTLGGNVAASTVTIGSDDTLNASGSGFNINVLTGWTNNNSFIPQSGTVTFTGTSTGVINRGASAFNNLTFTGVGGIWSFSTTTLALNGNLTIATGTVTLPTGTTTIGGSFLNTGGTFLHNNGEVRMTSATAGKVITQRAGTFLNAFYDLVFTGAGAWSFSEAAATTTRNFSIQSGTVTSASSTLTVGGDFTITGSGAYLHNNAELLLLVQDSNVVRTNGSVLNNVRTRGAASSWYSTSWSARKPVVINAAQVPATQTDFPIYLNLADLGAAFFTAVKVDGSDIRVTTSDGVTEVPFELVSINTGTQSGELHFKAPSVSSSTNTTFYVYYGNSAATAYASTTTYGARNVWTNGYAAVYHFNQDPTGTGAIILDSTANAQNGTRVGTAAAGRLVAAKVGSGLDMVGTAGDYVIEFPSPGIGSASSFTYSGWFKNGSITSGANTDGAGTYMMDRPTATAELTGLKVIGGNYAQQFRYGDGSGIGSVDGAAATTGVWQNVVWGRTYNSNRFIYVDKAGVTTGDNASALTPPPARLGGHQSNTVYDGVADEFRIASVARSSAWISTEYNNQASSTSFYTVNATQPRAARTFVDTNATIAGNLIVELGGDSVFPTGVLSVGGSFANTGMFDSNTGTVRFNATAGAKTIAAGSSTFATLEFVSGSGDFTITQNATATVAVNLTSAAQFTLQSGRILAAAGTFTNAATASSTTWTGSTLRLSGSDSALNVKSHGGDTYGTLETVGDTDVTMWNSSATTYVTGSTSSIYSQDHAGVDGTLNIYGDYIRTTGTEYWSYATDFDGAALTGSTSRQANIRIATSSAVSFVNASLNLVGAATASTTVDAQTGAFALAASNTTITAQHFRVAGTDVNGFALLASTTLSTFTDGLFTVVPGRTGITLASSTVAKNPSGQYFRINFATSSAGAASNVTMVGTSSSFVWFRTGAGNLYGEAYDTNDANPGSVRFDDSSNSITITGVVYADDGITPLGAPTCNGVTPNVRIVVDGGTYTASTTCAVGTGAYTLSGVNYIGDPKAVVYLNTNGGVAGTVVTKTLTNNISNMNIYANRVITRHEDTLPLTIADTTLYDFTKDTDIKFVATTTGSTSLRTMPGTELYVFASTTFTPLGNLTLFANASSTSFDGTLQLGTNATFSASGTETHTLGGRLVLATTSNFVAASSTFVFNATTSGKSITSPTNVTFNQLQFTGVAGGWNITAPLTVQGNMDIATGTVTGTSNITLVNGSLSGNGTLSLGAGTTTINQSNTLGGVRAWTFANLVLGSGSVAGTTTPNTSATTTVSGRLTISAAHVLDTNATLWDLSGTGTVLVENGTLLEDTSTIRYSGSSANILATGYYNLMLNGGAGSATYTGTGIGIAVANDLVIGGAATTTANFTTSDPVLSVGGDVLIRSTATLIGSDSASFTVARNWTNAGTFTSSSGTVTMNGTASSTITAGNSSFGNLTINGVGSFTVAASATTTGNFLLVNHASFTMASSQTMAVGGTFTNGIGGAFTTWTGSTLSLYGGGTKVINASTTNDVYQTIAVAAGTNVRMWNSSATTYAATGGIYSQNHGGVSGNLNIYGAVTVTSGADYWSYATDFDGTDRTLTPRAVSVAFASSSSITYTGGSLSAIGAATATTTLANQGVGTYGVLLSGTTAVNWNTVSVRNIDSNGVVISGTPTVTDFSRTDHLVQVNNGSGITVGGTVIDVNQAKNFTNNVFASSSGVSGARNVTATGTSVSSWRFTNHAGALSGEAFDTDPAGDPGYVVWDNSAAMITVSGNVYSDEGVTVSPVCNASTSNIVLRVAGLTTYSTSCNPATGAYSISGVAFSPADNLTVYIDNNIRKAVTVSTDPVSSISNMHLYENRVIVRHENTNPLTIAKMAVWDSSDDGDIMFTATDAATDTLVLPSDQKLLIWNGKTFEPNGNVTVSGGGGGGAQDGTLEAQTNATFRAIGTETHSIGGSLIFGTGATFTAGQSTTTFTTTGSARTVDVNAAAFYNLAFTGSGSWTVSDATLTTLRSLSQSNGVLTYGSATTTVGASFTATGGSFVMTNAPLVFVSTTTGNSVRLNNSVVPGLRFAGAGGAWTMTDANATTSGAFTVASGTVTLLTGNLAVGRNFENLAGTIVHNTAKLILTATSSANLTANNSSLYSVRFVGAGPFVMTDANLTLLDSLTLATGTLTLATGTVSVGGDFLAASGTLAHASGTVLFNATSAGKFVTLGTNPLYNVVFGSGTGGWTLLGDATTTNNFSITGASSFTKQSNTTLSVGGVFTNSVGGSNTTWATSTLRLYGISPYTLNTKTTGGDVYGTLSIGAGLSIRSWNSSAATTTVASGASWYSQDHAAVDGALNIYGNFVIATTTEYWSYATDFDGTALGGSSRAVNVRLAQNATTTLQSGTLQMIGAIGATTTVARQSTSTYAFAVTGGTLNAQYYSFAHLGVEGLKFTNAPTITNLANGYFDLAVASGSLMTVSASTLDANASKVWPLVGFNAVGPLTGYNVQVVGSSSNAWRFTGSYGTLQGEAFDIDGITACGSIRFDNSACLLTQQTQYRWRNDNGGEGVPTSEWFNTGFTYRQSVRVVNPDATAYSNTAVKVSVAYDASMQSDFDDLRFTAGDGLTPIPYWVERYTASTDATVWVKVPYLGAADTAKVLMYYGSSTAAASSSGATTFSAFDDFETNSLSAYAGDTSMFQTDTAPVYGGSYALEALSKSGRTTDGIFRTALTVSQGQIIRWMQYMNTTTGSGDEACTLFGVQSPGVNNNNYALCLEQFGVDRMVISKNVSDNDVSGTVLASSTATYATGWYEVEVDWKTDNSINAYLRNTAGSLIATTSATDASYTTGGMGFTFWFQNGSWDSFTARPRAMIAPTVYFGAKQTYGGASFATIQNAAGSGIPGTAKRLRIAVENSGLDVTSQVYRLEYASKGASPSCEAVTSASFAVVPNQSSCGSSPVCMQTSSQIADGDATTDLLASTTGAFTAGKMVESPSSAAASMNLNQSNFTELEYVLTPTINATSSYCFRVTNGGTPLDYYSRIAELNLQFDPVFGAITLNNGQPITLTPGATTTVYATGTVTDFNGYTDLVAGSSTIYRSGVGPSCTANDNSCYKGSTAASTTCSFINCAGNTCTLSCRADINFFADPTDITPYEGQDWGAYLEVNDSGGGYDFESAPAVELLSLRALTVDSAINFGSLAVAANTGSFNPTTTVANLGNTAFNIDVIGTDLSDGAASRIPANQQKFATSSFTYSSCVGCSIMSSSTPTNLALGLAKPTVSNPPVTKSVYWGIAVPFGVRSVPHQGINVFTPVSIP